MLTEKIEYGTLSFLQIKGILVENSLRKGAMNMLATIEKQSNEFLVTFQPHLKHSKMDVWEMLTNNERLALWFDELQVIKLGKGGYLHFDMGDGTFQRIDIIDFEEYEILEFTWDDNFVRFELLEESDGCNLVLIERITEITEHTAKDIAGWHVCLNVIQSILDNERINSRKEQWEYWYEKYTKALNSYL